MNRFTSASTSPPLHKPETGSFSFISIWRRLNDEFSYFHWKRTLRIVYCQADLYIQMSYVKALGLLFSLSPFFLLCTYLLTQPKYISFLLYITNNTREAMLPLKYLGLFYLFSHYSFAKKSVFSIKGGCWNSVKSFEKSGLAQYSYYIFPPPNYHKSHQRRISQDSL